VKCAAGVDASGRLVPDAHEQGRWRPGYRVCGAELPNDGDEVTCPACGEGWIRLSAIYAQEEAKS
jgi:hypothetical protein